VTERASGIPYGGLSGSGRPGGNWSVYAVAQLPPAGFVESTTLVASAPTHSCALGHEPGKMIGAPWATGVTCQVPPAGLLEVRMLPPELMAQKDADGHETPIEPAAHALLVHVPGETSVELQAFCPPVGSVEAMTLSAPSTATQSVVDAQETARMYPGGVAQCAMHGGNGTGSVYWSVQAFCPPAGSVDVRIWLSLKPTQNDVDGHDRPER
jgi:hypothetical protein